MSIVGWIVEGLVTVVHRLGRDWHPSPSRSYLPNHETSIKG